MATSAELEDSWTHRFAPSTGIFVNDMRTQLDGYGTYNWHNFFDTRKVWVTEFNCNSDG